MRGIVAPGMAQRTTDWLVIPLDAELHVGNKGIDYGMGVETWENFYGKQLDMLVELSVNLGYNVFHMAGLDIRIEGLDVVGVDTEARREDLHRR